MKEKPNILIAEDEEANRKLLVDFLTTLGYRATGVSNGKEALEKILEHKPDIIILDINMPEMDGFEVLKIIKSNPETRIIPVIVITGLGDNENHIKAVELGADDFLTKPFNIHFLRARIRSLLSIKILNDLTRNYQKRLEENNYELLKELIKTQEVTIVALAKLAEFRDPETGEHLERMREYAKVLASELKRMGKYSRYIDDKYIENIYKSTPLHDIGKVGIPDHILLKPSKLTPEEFSIMKKHTVIGGDAIKSAIEEAGMKTSFLDMAKHIAYYHHEKWDGTGYPYGLKGDEIPLSARITAVADVYDALTTKRVYKEAYRHEIAKEIISSEAGKHFDPEIVEAFLSRENDFISLKERYKDKPVDKSNTFKKPLNFSEA